MTPAKKSLPIATKKRIKAIESFSISQLRITERFFLAPTDEVISLIQNNTGTAEEIMVAKIVTEAVEIGCWWTLSALAYRIIALNQTSKSGV